MKKQQQQQQQQQLLQVERFDGTIPYTPKDMIFGKKQFRDAHLYYFFKLFDYCVPKTRAIKGSVSKTGYYLHSLKAEEFISNHNFDKVQTQLLMVPLTQDDFARTAALTYNSYKKHRGKNYVMSKNLTKYLSKISLDVPVDTLPNNFTVYFEPQNLVDETDGSKVVCSFVSIGSANDLDSVLITLVTEDDALYAFRTMNLGNLTEDRQSGQTINDLCRRYEEESKLQDEPKMAPSIGKSDYRLLTESTCLRTILNAVLYVNNPNEEFEEQLNEFATKKSKLEVQKKVLCQLPFYRIGFKNAEHLRLVLEKEVSVKWHFRTQHYGKGNKLTKRILIADYTKNLKRKV